MATIDKQTFHIKAVEYGAMHLLDQPRRPVPEPEGATMLELSRLSKRFGSLQALDDLSLSLDRGEIVGFVGSNGAGKSTTMRIVMGVLARRLRHRDLEGCPRGRRHPTHASATCPRSAASTPG